MKRTLLVATGVVAITILAAAPAMAAVTYYTDGTATSGTCESARFDGSSKLDDPRLAGTVKVGTVQEWSAMCNPPGSQGRQRCFWTTAGLISGGKIKSIIWTVVPGGNVSGQPLVTRSYGATGTGYVDSPVVCQYQIDGNSHSPKAQGFNSDGSKFYFTVFE